MNNLIEFNDYINKYLNLSSNEWITIYENLKNEVNNIENDLYTFSVLSKNRISNKKEILKKENLLSCYEKIA